MLQEIFGVSRHIRSVADSCALSGDLAVAQTWPLCGACGSLMCRPTSCERFRPKQDTRSIWHLD